MGIVNNISSNMILGDIKAKVIDAHNDTNTDTDRAIIQKEITQYYDEINDIAAETTFNKKLLLLGKYCPGNHQ